MSRLPISLRQLALRQANAAKPAFPSRSTSAFIERVPSSRSLSTTSRPLLQRLELDRRRPEFNHINPSCEPRRRWNSSLAVSGSEPASPKQDLPPAYQITFTCKPCGHRSSHRMTKQAYHHGTVLIKCPSCENRHVIADHLKVFLDQATTLEDILKKQTADGKPLSSLIKKGKLGMRTDSMIGNEGEEDLEFWEDGTETLHEKSIEETKT